jgi:hypothetical protein
VPGRWRSRSWWSASALPWLPGVTVLATSARLRNEVDRGEQDLSPWY